MTVEIKIEESNPLKQGLKLKNQISSYVNRQKMIGSLETNHGKAEKMIKKPTYEELEKRIQELEQAGSGRKRADEALKESEERLKALSEASFEAIFLSEKGICLDQNQAAERMFGYSRAEAVGRHGTKWIVPENREQVKNYMLSGYGENPTKGPPCGRTGPHFHVKFKAGR
jgi:PAS domain-containing protein